MPRSLDVSQKQLGKWSEVSDPCFQTRLGFCMGEVTTWCPRDRMPREAVARIQGEETEVAETLSGGRITEPGDRAGGHLQTRGKASSVGTEGRRWGR